MPFTYGIQCALEDLPTRFPSVLRGTFSEVTDQAAQAAYDGVELYIHTPAEHNGAAYRSQAADKGLSFASICTGLELLHHGLGLTSDDQAIRTRAVDRLKEHLDLAAELQCALVVGTMRGNIATPAAISETRDRLAAALQELADYAEPLGVPIVVENILQYISNWLCTMDDVGAFIEGLGLPGVKIHADTHSMHMEDPDPFAAVRKWGPLIGYVHFSDSNRGYPGAGAIDFKAHFHALMDSGYSGWITIEAQPFPTGVECAQRGLDYLKHLEAAATIERLPFMDDDMLRF